MRCACAARVIPLALLSQEGNIEKQRNQPPKPYLSRLKNSPRKDVTIMFIFAMDADKKR